MYHLIYIVLIILSIEQTNDNPIIPILKYFINNIRGILTQIPPIKAIFRIAFVSLFADKKAL